MYFTQSSPVIRRITKKQFNVNYTVYSHNMLVWSLKKMNWIIHEIPFPLVLILGPLKKLSQTEVFLFAYQGLYFDMRYKCWSVNFGRVWVKAPATFTSQQFDLHNKLFSGCTFTIHTVKPHVLYAQFYPLIKLIKLCSLPVFSLLKLTCPVYM